MTDKPKTIQEALAEVQRNLTEAAKAKTDWTDASSYNTSETPKKSAEPKPSTTPKVEAPKTTAAPIKKGPSGFKTFVRGGLLGAAVTGAATYAANNPEIRAAAGKAVDWAKEKAGQAGSWIKDKASDLETNLDKQTGSAVKSAPATPAASTSSSSSSPTTPSTTAAPKTPESKPADKPVSVVKTKGGDYNVYAKDSEKAADFRKTYADAKGNFEWEGRKYAKPSSEPAKSTESNKPESESGGKRKKMSEDTNPLIASFLALQEKNPSNMFEAAKKAKKDYDKDGKVESPKDEVWGSRFRAAKMAGKMEEAALKDPKDPSVQGSGDVTMEPAKPAAPVHVKPTNPERIKNLKDPRDPSVQGSGDVTYKEEVEEIDEIKVSTAYSYASKKMEKNRKGLLPGDHNPTSKIELKNMTNAANRTDKDYYKQRGFKKMGEEVEFSQAEIDHINSFFEAVAPSRAEPTKGVNPSVSNISLTDDTLEEGRPRKNPTPEATERDARQHIQVQAGRAAGGSVVDFKHDNGKISKLTPGMGRTITAHLNGLKPAERQEAVKRMHASPEGLKI